MRNQILAQALVEPAFCSRAFSCANTPRAPRPQEDKSSSWRLGALGVLARSALADIKLASVFSIAFAIVISIAGCTDNKPSPQQSTQLSSGFKALDEQQSALAIDRADEYLRQQPHGPGSAEALYLKGRGYEQKAAADPKEIQRNLSEARTAYQEALMQQPSPKTEGYIRASLSNVAFFEDDYSTALSEASRAYSLVDTPEIQSMLLYRMGVSQQRLSRFTEADRTFEQVQQRYPNSAIAERAREHQGQRNFFVQLATFNTPAGADKAMDSLKNSGIVVSKRSDKAGHTLVDAGPFSTYESARDAKTRFAAQYPDALIVP